MDLFNYNCQQLSKRFLFSLSILIFLVHSVSMGKHMFPFPPILDSASLNRVIVINQHGEQNYRYNFPLIDGQPPSPNNTSIGHLSPYGRSKMFSLGQALKSRYRSFITDNPLDYQAQSSDSDGSIESILLILHGLVRTSGEWIYDNSTDYSPIPVHTGPKGLDCALDSDCNCPYADQWNQSMESHPTMRKIKSSFIDTINYLVGKVNLTNMDSLVNLTLFYEDIEYASSHNQTLPKFITPSLFNNLSQIKAQVESFEACSTEILSIRVTRLFNSLSTLIKEVNDSDDPNPLPRFNLFSSSGLLLSSVRCALGISDSPSEISTPDGSALVLEIHQINDQHFIQIFYWNESFISEPYQLTPTYCAHNMTIGVCSIKEILNQFDKYILTDWPEKCGLCPNGYRANEIMAIILCIIILTILLVTCLAVVRRRKNRDDYEEIESGQEN